MPTKDVYLFPNSEGVADQWTKLGTATHDYEELRKISPEELEGAPKTPSTATGLTATEKGKLSGWDVDAYVLGSNEKVVGASIHIYCHPGTTNALEFACEGYTSSGEKEVPVLKETIPNTTVGWHAKAWGKEQAEGITNKVLEGWARPLSTALYVELMKNETGEKAPQIYSFYIHLEVEYTEEAGRLAGAIQATSTLKGGPQAHGEATGRATLTATLKSSGQAKGSLRGHALSASTASGNLQASGALRGATTTTTSLTGRPEATGSLTGHINCKTGLSGASQALGQLAGRLHSVSLLAARLAGLPAILRGVLQAVTNLIGRLTEPASYEPGRITITSRPQTISLTSRTQTRIKIRG